MLWRVKEVQRFVPHFLHSPYSTGDFDIRKSAIIPAVARASRLFLTSPGKASLAGFRWRRTLAFPPVPKSNPNSKIEEGRAPASGAVFRAFVENTGGVKLCLVWKSVAGEGSWLRWRVQRRRGQTCSPNLYHLRLATAPFEIRNPKPEARKKPEIRTARRLQAAIERRVAFRHRLVSDFGLRISF
jgi:hypothetical protein